MKFPRKFYEAVATMTGCIIGAGILGIPFVFVRAGFWSGVFSVVILGFAALLLHLLLGEVTLRTRKLHQLAGYAMKYLGRPGKYLMMISMVVGIYGAMLAYTLGVSQSLSAVFGISQWFWAFLFYVIMGVLIFGGLNVLEKSELWMEGLKLLVFAAILVLLFSSSQFTSARFVGFSLHKIFLTYGVVLFAFVGTAAVPEVREELRKHSSLFFRAIVFGTLIPLAVYLLFATAVVGVAGGFTTEVATIGLAPLLGGAGFVFLHVFAILAMTTSFVALGYALKDMYHCDFGLPRWESWSLTMIVPVVLIFLGANSFIGALEVAGVFAGGIAGIIIVFMHYKAKVRSERKPEYSIDINWIGYGLLVALFGAGMIYELVLLL